MPEKDNLITDREVAKIEGVSPSTVWKWCKRVGADGKLLIPAPVISRHKYTRWSENEVREHVERMKANQLQEAIT